MILNLPNSLTLFRIAVLPLLVGAFYLEGNLAHYVAAGLFVVASVTDYLDGLLARRWAQQSAFGTFLDPIADKLVVAVALFMLAAHDQIVGWTLLPALVILCREILVSGLREFLGPLRVRLPVTPLAKWKTTVQMVAIALLLLGDAVPTAEFAGEVALWAAALLTLITGWSYLRAGFPHMTEDPATAPAESGPAAHRGSGAR